MHVEVGLERQVYSESDTARDYVGVGGRKIYGFWLKPSEQGVFSTYGIYREGDAQRRREGQTESVRPKTLEAKTAAGVFWVR